MGDMGMEQWWSDTDSGKQQNVKKNLSRTNLGLNQSLCSVIEAYKYNVSVNNTTLYFIYNKNSVLSGRYVSTFIGSSSLKYK